MKLSKYLSGFKVKKIFKESGQKKVYLVENNEFDETILKIGKYACRSHLNRAKREVEIQQSLYSDYYPKIFEFRKFPDNQFCINEEYIDSIPLSEKFDKYSNQLIILELLKELVLALTLLWNQNVIHRDLKPDNILIKSDGSIVIIDLGIVLAIEQTTLTAPINLSPCTPNYSAPEQLTNRKTEIDFRTDQFILGITILQAINLGKHPFDPDFTGSGNSIVENIISNNYSSPKLNSDEYLLIRPIIKKLLQPEPYLRYRKAKFLIDDINKNLESKNENQNISSTRI